MYNFYYDPILNEDVEQRIILGFHNCYIWEIQKFLALDSTVSLDYPDYFCLDDG